MIKNLKPTTPSSRHTVLIKNENLSKDKLPSKLMGNVKYSAGRSAGKISVRHKGGRVKRKYRVIDFERSKRDIEGVVESFHYDPNRSAHLALIKYPDGDRKLILATKNMKEGQKVMAGDEAPFNDGCAMPLKRVPSGSFVHNVEINPGKGGVLGRSAGSAIQKQGNSGEYVQLKMPSGEIRLVRGESYATLGVVSNEMHNNRKLGKAGRRRKMGFRPSVRGVAMSYKHPHAGGQGKSGRVGPGGPVKTPWGAKQGVKTRRNKMTNKYIVHRKTTRRRPNVKKYKTIV